ncbi:MAG TPA: NUDIX hydrolase [Mycobacteriales bacterium]|nr:NUDIX hydrolase [Mycobacteriales bacterium]
MSTPPNPPAATPRHAATVVLLRDGPGGVEAYLLRRVSGMPFAGGMTAFPGGSVDPRDADASLAWAGPDPSRWATAFGTDQRLARSLLCAAVRETFEEAGVLLAGPSGGGVVDGSHPRWEADRVALERRELSLADLLARRGLVLRADLLRPWAHWITPRGEPRRYDTRFFVAALPAGQRPPDASGAFTREADQVAWVRPADALAEFAGGARPMLPPTLVTLREIAGYATVTDVLAAGWERTIEPITPRLSLGPEGNHVLLPDGRRLDLPPGFPP